MKTQALMGLALVVMVTGGSAAQDDGAPAGSSHGVTSPGVVSLCPATFGCRFNLEPSADAVPQDAHGVDFLRGSAPGGNDLVVGVATDQRGRFGSRPLVGSLSPDTT